MQANNAKQSGATMLEAAIAMPLFLIMLLVFFELMRIFYVQLALQYGVTRGARRAAMVSGLAAADVRALINQELGGLGVIFEPADVLVVCPLNDFNSGTNCNLAGDFRPGEERELVVYRGRKLVHSFPVVASGTATPGQLWISATVIVENQPV